MIERAIRESAAEAVLRTVPASKPAIYEALTKVDAAATTTTEERCMICLEILRSFYDNEKAVEVVGMPFFHVYHKKCIIRWLNLLLIVVFVRVCVFIYVQRNGLGMFSRREQYANCRPWICNERLALYRESEGQPIIKICH